MVGSLFNNGVTQIFQKKWRMSIMRTFLVLLALVLVAVFYGGIATAKPLSVPHTAGIEDPDNTYQNLKARRLQHKPRAKALTKGLPITRIAGVDGSIQQCSDASAPGDIVSIPAGNWQENVIARNPGVIFQGAGSSLTTIYPAISGPNPCGASSLCPTASNVFLIEANDITIDGVCLDGQTTGALVPSGLVRRGVDLAARNGVITNHAAGVFQNLTVKNCQVRNIYLRGIYASSGGSFNFQNNIVDNVSGDGSSIGIFNFGGNGQMTSNTVTWCNDSIASNHSKGTVVRYNVVGYSVGYSGNSGSGIHTDNNGSLGGSADLLAENTVTSGTGAYGIWVFATYLPVQITTNTVNQQDVAFWIAGQSVPTTITLTGNHVDLNNRAGSVGLYQSTDVYGYFSSHSSVVFDNNSLLNCGVALEIESETGQVLNLLANFNRLVGNAVHTERSPISFDGNPTAGTYNVDLTNNWWGCNAGPGNGGCGVAEASFNTNPWIVGTITANPTAIEPNETSTVSLHLQRDSNGTDTSGSGTIPSGSPVTFTTDIGSFGVTPDFMSLGVASALYSADGNNGVASIGGSIDGQIVSLAMAVPVTVSEFSVE